MQKKMERYAGVLFWMACVLALAVSVVSVLFVGAYRKNREAAASAVMLSRAEMRNAVQSFGESFGAGDAVLSYHYAASAAEHAAQAGESAAAVWLRELSRRMLTGVGEKERERISGETERFLSDGTVPKDTLEAEEPGKSDAAESARHPLPSYSREAAQRTLIQLFGGNHRLREAERSGEGELVYSCSNAYAVVDASTGQPLETAISMEPGTVLLRTEDCIAYAMQFLSDYYAPNLLGTAEVQTVFAESGGLAGIVVRCRDRTIRLAVRRDNGRVVRMTAR